MYFTNFIFESCTYIQFQMFLWQLIQPIDYFQSENISPQDLTLSLLILNLYPFRFHNPGKKNVCLIYSCPLYTSITSFLWLLCSKEKKILSYPTSRYNLWTQTFTSPLQRHYHILYLIQIIYYCVLWYSFVFFCFFITILHHSDILHSSLYLLLYL